MGKSIRFANREGLEILRQHPFVSGNGVEEKSRTAVEDGAPLAEGVLIVDVLHAGREAEQVVNIAAHERRFSISRLSTVLLSTELPRFTSGTCYVI